VRFQSDPAQELRHNPPTARRKDEEHGFQFWERETPNTAEMFTSVFLLCVHIHIAKESVHYSKFHGEKCQQ